MFKIYWPMQVTNEEIRARAGLEAISKEVARRRHPNNLLQISLNILSF